MGAGDSCSSRWLGIVNKGLSYRHDDSAAVPIAFLPPSLVPVRAASVTAAAIDENRARLLLAEQVSDIVGEPWGNSESASEVYRPPMRAAY